MPESVITQAGCVLDWTADADYSSGDIIQMPDGRAGQVTLDVTSGNLVGVRVEGIVKANKTTSMVFLKGGRAFWDFSANKCHFKKVNDQDFLAGRYTQDAASADTVAYIELNVNPPPDIDIARDAFSTILVGTPAALAASFGEPRRRGGSNFFQLSATSEAQKVDALSVEGFATAANAIIEFALRFPNGGSASASDFNVGIASGTHASDFDSVAQYLALHVDGGSTNLNLQSKDGTTTVASTDTTLDYTAGTALTNRFEVWMDMRDPADVQVYIDGVLVLGSTVFNVAAYAGQWFLIAHVEKSTGTETGDMSLDWLRARFSQI